MKCQMCDGKGWTDKTDISVKLCSKCNGTGQVEQTNEEWFCQLPTEEKAVVIMNIRNLAVYKEQIVEWLKQPHTNEVEK